MGTDEMLTCGERADLRSESHRFYRHRVGGDFQSPAKSPAAAPAPEASPGLFAGSTAMAPLPALSMRGCNTKFFEALQILDRYKVLLFQRLAAEGWGGGPGHGIGRPGF